VAFGAVYQLGSLICFRQALGFFYKDFLLAIMIYPWTYIPDVILKWAQWFDRTQWRPL